MLTATEIAGFVGAGLAGAAYIPQISHLIKARCSAGISRLAFAVWLLASLLITARAIAIHAGVFIALGGIQIVATTLIMIYAARYKNTPCPIHHPRQPGVTTDRGIREHQVPMSVLRYAQRTHEPLVAVDATGDDRFARDPYFADADYCSLLAVPILSRSLLRAVLLLENRLLRGTFTTERLDRLKLIAGQLAVSLDNAKLYAELTASRARIVAAGDQARGGSNGTCTTAPSSAWSRWPCSCARRRPRCRPGSARSWTAPSPRPPARWRSCARPRTASTRPSWPRAACGLPSRRSPAARRSPSTCGSTRTSGCRSRSRSAPTT